MESYVDQSEVKGCVASVQEETLVAATGSPQDTRLLSLIEKLVNRVEKLEKDSRDNGGGSSGQSTNRRRGGAHDRCTPVEDRACARACWRCGRIGHLQKNCPKTRYPRHRGWNLGRDSS